MKTEELYQQLKQAYSEKNLHEISSSIINLYRNREEDAIRYVYNLFDERGELKGEKLSRIFSRLIMAYHPDRYAQIQEMLRDCRERDDFEQLERHSHILDLLKVEFETVGDQVSVYEDFEEEDIWDYTAEGYSYIDDEEQETDEFDFVGDVIMNHGFIAAVKRKIYGYLDVEFPIHLIEDMEVIEMAEYEIENLDGVEYCTYARIIDLSGNNLTDVSALGQLEHLEEIYLQNNQVGDIITLGNLPSLRVLDISNNDVDDISPLFDCQLLEFVNVMGNRIPDWQIEQMSLAGVVVVA